MRAPVYSRPCTSVRILFLGQCLQYGYEDVDSASTFVALAANNLAARFPAVRLRLDLKHLYHPKGLKAILRHRLWLSRKAPEVVDTARSFLQKMEAKRSGRSGVLAHTPLDEFIAWQPPIALDEYERLVREGVEMCRSAGCQAVLLGPGRFNEDTTDTYAGVTPDLWYRVNEMVRRLGLGLDVPAIDTFGALSERGGEVFLRNNIRWSRTGHQVVAREVERVLASRIALLGSRGLVG